MKKGFQFGKVLAVSGAHMVHDIYAAFLAPLLPLLVVKFGISLSMAGMLDAVRNTPTLFNPVFGLFVDKIRVKYFVILTPAVSAVIMSLLGIAPSYAVVVIMIFIAGISSALFHIPTPVLVKNLSADRTGTGMSFYMFGGELSRTLGPLVITAAVTLWGFEGSWRLVPFGLAASLSLVYILRDYSPERDSGHGGRSDGAGRGFRELLPLFLPIGGYLFFLLAMKVAVTLYLPAYLVSRGMSLVSASLHLSALQFAGAAGTVFSGIISDRIGRKLTLYISGLASPLLMWLFIAGNDLFALPILVLIGFFLFAHGPVLLALVQDSDSRSPSFTNGLYMTISFCTRSLCVFLVGHFTDVVGFALTYRAAAVMALGVLPCIFFLPDYKVKAGKRVLPAEKGAD